ncbi:MAG: malto-oligosyltrehalose synthase, partial [Bryobacteraceae bacterium]
KNIDRLHEFLERQNFRLAYWRTAEQDLVYRRFFDVNTLVGLRMESEQVFADTHALVLRWLREGVLDGIRVDHPDGLQNPRFYFEHLRKESPDVWIVGEKILEPGEKLRAEWPIDGTTGYDYLNQAGGLLVNPANEEEFNRIYTDFTSQSTDYPAMCRDKKHRVLRDLLGSDVNRLTSLFLDVCKSHRDRRDYTREDVIRAIRELVACFPVYRTYVVPNRDEITEDDECYVNEAVNAAKQNRPELDSDLFEFIGQVLLLKVRGVKETEFVQRFQQFTGPAMAKGVEDTVFYNYNRLISLNEVGGDPGVFGVSLENYHAWCAETQRSHPRTMLSSSTHDTKRSEDVRARISLLSEIPAEWEAALRRWRDMNAHLKKDGAPDPNTEYFLYQTLIGTWPITSERLLAYMEKASREAKELTSWLLTNKPFEEGTKAFIEGLFQSDGFLGDLESFVGPLIEPGRINSLALLLLKLTSPGIPDMYQGTELWDLSLVDPDNRRPVDYSLRRRLLSELPNLSLREAWTRQDEGIPKLLVLSKVNRVRQQRPEDFGPDAGYLPIEAIGERAEHVVSYLRGKNVLVVTPRLVMGLRGNWYGTSIRLPDGEWRSVLGSARHSGREVPVAEILRDFPVELLVRE